ncbi:CRISPR-associated helicase Cas3 [Hydrogenobacter thermophilus TK-6]|uniref:CRISPR-associated helicase n=1 Tax=Hydrogenobacter thermophilus (strain DSM 6534 / IAM 12695 / TK-6) TaxID=608538 RepID=D3DIP9_HYDTT|nr:CRISPR-associated helicase/endonuclease Cas3 [Hydrogenobacter thermophilus]ADO45627.1 CRISPR-associated helicase Cas3 [Hydrogenobacter thermophilus TK-6]BAI69701.1 CRISPR-associated helicase [Hydrogenobacter thermophilus TK-6]
METKSGIYSHPGIFIEDHINRCLELLSFYLQRELPLISDEFVLSATLSVALHDFGKCTKYFQDYITGKGRRSEFSKHSLLSAVYTYYCAKKLISDPKLLSFSFVACKSHHTDPESFTSEFTFDKDEIERLKIQIESIDQEKTNIFISNLNLPENVKKSLFLNKEEFKNKLTEIEKEIKSFRKSFHKCESKIEDFVKFQYLFSLLLDSDKTETGAKSFRPKRVSCIPLHVVSRYKANNLPKSREIDHLREEAYKEILSKEVDLSKRIYSITLPTGMGKTLTGFAFALKLRELIKNEKGTTPRIIYSLPFVSIIDQNAEVLIKVLKTEFHEIEGRILIKHHHLSEPRFEEYEFSEARLLTEGWNSEIVITTFVQLFHTLISARNSEFRRFNKLANSILLIDEVQALPTKYWHLIREVLREVSKNLDVYIILMTATQPYLLEEAVELADPHVFRKRLDRIRVFINLEGVSLGQFVNSLEFKKDKTYLFITNTISSSKELYRLLKERMNEKICYLSTSVLPYERLRRIEEIKKGKYRFVVSTQLVEAGVDIDFDEVYRDFAPFDSLNQSAGRCNRNMERGKGNFYVIKLTDSEGKPFYSRIYDSVLCNITEEMLKGVKELSEPELTNLIEEYFCKVWEKTTPDKSKKILEAVKCFSFSSGDISIRNFELMEDDRYKKDVFVEINDEASEVWSRAKSIIEDLKKKKIDIFKAKEEFEKLKPDFYKFVVTVNIKENEPSYDQELKTFFVSQDMLERYYNSETGFIEKGEAFFEV